MNGMRYGIPPPKLLWYAEPQEVACASFHKSFVCLSQLPLYINYSADAFTRLACHNPPCYSRLTGLEERNEIKITWPG